MSKLRERLESRQVPIYFLAITAAVLVAITISGTTAFETGINPALAFMLFVTFLQVPLPELGRAFVRFRFLGALLLTNFVAIPVLVAALLPLLPANPLVRLGVLMVLLTPCIDYVVTFSHLGKADAKALLASTPLLLIIQMALLPFYLGLFLGNDASLLVQAGPFLHAFIWLIAVPLVLAAIVQLWGARSTVGQYVAEGLGFFPVPATALVLFIVVAAVLPQLGPVVQEALPVVPVYIAFAIAAPLLGWTIGRILGLDAASARAVAFSAGTRNSLVVLPLAFAVPDAAPLLPAILVTQTLIELVGELLYIRLISRLGSGPPTQGACPWPRRWR